MCTPLPAPDAQVVTHGPGSGGTTTVHRLHWAGTEMAAEGTGFMDGAVRAGGAAAQEVVRELLREYGAPAPKQGQSGLSAESGLLANEVSL